MLGCILKAHSGKQPSQAKKALESFQGRKCGNVENVIYDFGAFCINRTRWRGWPHDSPSYYTLHPPPASSPCFPRCVLNAIHARFNYYLRVSTFSRLSTRRWTCLHFVPFLAAHTMCPRWWISRARAFAVRNFLMRLCLCLSCVCAGAESCVGHQNVSFSLSGAACKAARRVNNAFKLINSPPRHARRQLCLLIEKNVRNCIKFLITARASG